MFDVMLRSSDDSAAETFWNRSGGSAIIDRVAARYGLARHRPPGQRALVQHHQHGQGPGALLRHVARRAAAGCRPNRPTSSSPTWRSRHRPRPTAWCPAALSAAVRHPRRALRRTRCGQAGWMCCVGADWMHLSTGVIGTDRRYVMAISSCSPPTPPTARATITAGRQDHVPRRPDLSPALSPSRSGRRSLVRAGACSRRHAAIRAWSPESSTSGTSRPRQLGGRV